MRSKRVDNHWIGFDVVVVYIGEVACNVCFGVGGSDDLVEVTWSVERFIPDFHRVVVVVHVGDGIESNPDRWLAGVGELQMAIFIEGNVPTHAIKTDSDDISRNETTSVDASGL